MLTILTRILVFISALWIVRWLLSRLFASAAGQTTTRQRQNTAPTHKTVKDPVCGMYLDPRLAVRLEKGDGSYFFCSNECREKFAGRHA